MLCEDAERGWPVLAGGRTDGAFGAVFPQKLRRAARRWPARFERDHLREPKWAALAGGSARIWFA